jgi:hypothetical protein
MSRCQRRIVSGVTSTAQTRAVPRDELLSIRHAAALLVAGRAVLLDVDRYLRA